MMEVIEVTDRHVVLPRAAEQPPEDAVGIISSHANGGDSVHFDKNEGKSIEEENVDIPKLVTSLIENENLENIKDKILSGLNASTSTSQEDKVKIDIVQEGDEEVIELEFERAIDKAHTHTPYCPNCSRQITKVILRRKKPQDKTSSRDLLGCLPCFTIFNPSGGSLNPFPIFGSKWKPSSTPHGVDVASSGNTIVTQTGNSWNPLSLFGMQSGQASAKHDTVGGDQPAVSIQDQKGKEVEEESIVRVVTKTAVGSNDDVSKDDEEVSHMTGEPQKPSEVTQPNASGDVAIDVLHEAEVPGIPDVGASTWLEILKCIVYGGLMELIASLSVVSSTAASDATTLNIICIGLATLVSSLIIFGNHLIDLKNDTPQENSDKYQELLGRRGHFLLHSSFATLSFIIFGLVPPVVYAFTFRESDNKDYKILAVAVASFACILILAVAKAYLKETGRVSEYIKTVMYYVSMAVSVSGVAYAAGHLVTVLMEKLGWFESKTNGMLIPNMVLDTRAWGSY